jgi:hypothetical protein
MQWLRRHYGAGPLHLLGLLACFAVAAYAATRVLGASGWKGIFLWFVFCLVAHDLIGWPLYTLADRVLARTQHRHPGRRERVVPWVNHIRAPVIISGILLAMFFPLIFRLSQARYVSLTGFNENVYIINWILVTGILFAASGGIYLLRLWFGRRRAPVADVRPPVTASNGGSGAESE